MGVAGSGKSTQGRLLADEKGYAWLSSGDILRVLVTGTRRQQMLEGKLLSDQEMIKIFDKVLDLIDPTDEFVLDGFPRTLAQANWLLEQATKNRFSRIMVFHLFASEKVVHDRLRARGRLDDSEEAIGKRFAEYKEMTLPIIARFKELGATVYDIDAAQTPEIIHQQIVGHMNGKK
jgi:adenylate kinase